MARKLYYFKSLDSLKILTFWKIIQEDNFKLLDFDYYEGKKYSRNQLHDMEQTWYRLYDEYFVLTNDSTLKKNLKDKTDIIIVNSDMIFLDQHRRTLELLRRSVHNPEGIQMVYNNVKNKFPSLNIHYFESIDYNINLIQRTINALTNKFNRLQGDIRTDIEEKIKNVYDVVHHAESWIGRNLNIDDMVVMHWISVNNDVQQRIKAATKKNNG